MPDFPDEDHSGKEGKSISMTFFEHIAKDLHSAARTGQSQPLDAFLCFDVGVIRIDYLSLDAIS